MKLFSYDGPLVTGINRLTDYFLLGLLWMVASLPVVTYGAATTAMLFTAEVCLHKGEGKLFQTFWKSFRREFKQATLLWLIVAAVSVLLLLDAYVLSTIKLPDAVLTLLFVVFILVFSWQQLWFGYLSKFNDTIWMLLRNTIGMLFGSILWVLLLAVIAAAAIIGACAAIFFINPVLFLIPGAYGMLASMVLRKIFAKYISAQQEAAA